MKVESNVGYVQRSPHNKHLPHSLRHVPSIPCVWFNPRTAEHTNRPCLTPRRQVAKRTAEHTNRPLSHAKTPRRQEDRRAFGHVGYVQRSLQTSIYHIQSAKHHPFHAYGSTQGPRNIPPGPCLTQRRQDAKKTAEHTNHPCLTQRRQDAKKTEGHSDT